MDILIENLEKKIWKTRGARFNAHRRMRLNNLYSTLSVTFLTVSIIAMNLCIFLPENQAKGTLVTILTIGLSVFVLAISQVIYNPKNEKTVLEKRKRKVRPGRRKNENGKFPDTHTKKRQRLNVNKTVFKRCFFSLKNTQKVIVNSEEICIFT